MKYYLQQYTITEGADHIWYDKCDMYDDLLATICYYKLYGFYTIHSYGSIYNDFRNDQDDILNFQTFELAEVCLLNYLKNNNYIILQDKLEILI
jgi:hypothetical protein